VIRRELCGLTVRSNRARTQEDRLLLDADPSPPRIVELQGALHFATAERVGFAIGLLAERTSRVILDLRHVTSSDMASASFFAGLQRVWADAGRELVWSCAPSTGPLADLNAVLTRAGARIFDDIDHGLEYLEDLALAAAGRSEAATSGMRHFDLCHGFDEQEWTAFLACAAPILVEFEAGATIVRAGEPADCLFVVVEGIVRVSSPARPGIRPFRLASIGAGLTFGEMGLFEDGRRSADVVAEIRAACLKIKKNDFARLLASHPAIAAKTYANIVREQAARLRQASITIQSLK
jgi:hypothetical protein